MIFVANAFWIHSGSIQLETLASSGWVRFLIFFAGLTSYAALLPIIRRKSILYGAVKHGEQVQCSRSWQEFFQINALLDAMMLHKIKQLIDYPLMSRLSSRH